MALKGNWVANSYANDAAATTGYGGGTPASGSCYYNTTDAQLKVWTGSGWVACGVDPPSKAEIETIDSSVGGLRLAWDFSNTACYDGTTAPSENSNLRFVKNLAADNLYGSSPQNSEATGGYWVTHPSYMINDSTSYNEMCFRPRRSTSFSSSIGSPYDTARTVTKQTANAADYGSNGMGAIMSPWKGNATGYNGTDNSDTNYAGLGGARMVQSFYYPSNDSTYGSSGQNDSQVDGSWVVFMMCHPLLAHEQTSVMFGVGSQDNPNSGSGSSLCWAPADKGIPAISGSRHGNTDSWDTSTFNTYGGQWNQACGDRDRTQNTYWTSPAWDQNGLTSTSTSALLRRRNDLSVWNQGYGCYTYGGAFIQSKGTGDHTTNYSNNDNNAFLTPTMWTYASSENTPYGQVHFQNDSTDDTYNWHIASDYNLNPNWPYAEKDDHKRQTAKHYDWTTFGKSSYRSGAPHTLQWNNRDDSNWLTSAENFGSGYNSTISGTGCFYADFHVVLYFNKVLSASERNTIYNAYQTRFNLD